MICLIKNNLTFPIMKALLHSKPSLIKTFAISLLMVLSSVTTNAQNIVLEETFDNFDGSGPIVDNVDSWSGLTLEAVTTADLPSGWAISKALSGSIPTVRKAKGCVCVGATTSSSSSSQSKDLAYIQTAPIKEAGTYLLTFRAGAWNTEKEKTTLKLSTSIDGNISFSTSTFTLKKASFNTFSTQITLLKDNSPIRFKNVDRTSSRFFLDDIKIEKIDESGSGGESGSGSGSESGSESGGGSGSESGGESGGNTSGDTPSIERSYTFKKASSFVVGKEYLIVSKSEAGTYFVMDPQKIVNKWLRRVKVENANDEGINFDSEEGYKSYLIKFESSSSELFNLHSVSKSADIYSQEDPAKGFDMGGCGQSLTRTVWAVEDNPFGESGNFLVKCSGRYLEMSSGNEQDDFRTYKEAKYACPIYLYEKVEKSPAGTISIVAPEGYGTYYTDKSFVMPEGVDGAIVSDINDDGQLQISWKYPAGAIVPANTGLLVYASQKGSYPYYEAESSEKDGSNGSSDLSGNAANGIGQANNEVAGASAVQATNYLRGTTEETQVPEDASLYRFYQLTYGLVENVRTIGFFYASEDGGTFINGANKAYLAIPRTMNSVSSLFSLSHDIETTSIDQPLAGIMHSPAPRTCTIYTISGQRLTAKDLSRLPKGMYIINGKKVMVK